MGRSEIRCARESDALETARLSGELGYPMSGGYVREKTQHVYRKRFR